jgi:hypothetical protein
MKKAHNTYTEKRVWEIAQKESLNYKEILKDELTRQPRGSASAMSDMLLKFGILLIYPGAIHNTEVDWTPAIKYAKKHNLPLSKYVTSLI